MSEGGGVLKAAATAGVINLLRAPGLAVGQWIEWVRVEHNGAPRGGGCDHTGAAEHLV